MQLSRRMQMIVDMVKPSHCVADIGTDHGYIPIRLAESGIAEHIIAADVRKGPLARAREHIHECGMDERIELRLGDGLSVLSSGEAERIIISGMGGLLMIRILSDSPEILEKIDELILSPQSDIDSVRRHLHQTGFFIEAEDMTEEDGKFYTVMCCRHGEDSIYMPEDDLYGKVLIESCHPVLIDFLEEKTKNIKTIMLQLTGQNTEKCQNRLAELEQEFALIQAAAARAKRSLQK